MNGKSKNESSVFFKHRTRIATTVTCLILCLATLITTVSASNTVKVIYNGEEHEIRTMRTDVDDIIAQTGIEYDKNTNYIDTSRLEDYGIIVIDSMCRVTFVDGDRIATVKTHGTVEDALKEANITLGEHDELEGAKKDDYLSGGLVVTVKRAISVMISADGDITTAYVFEGDTIKDALDKAVITADDDDIISKPLDTVVTSNTAVKITRISVVERTETQVIEYETKEVKTNTLAKGKTAIKQAGVNGEQDAIYEDKFVDGELVESNLKTTKITKKPVDCIKLVGTKAAAVSANAKVATTKAATTKKTTASTTKKATSTTKAAAKTSGGAKLASGQRTISVFTPPASLTLTKDNVPTSYKKKIVGNATAYHCGTHTATGAAVKAGVVAVNPKQIPYHTPMWIVTNDGEFVYGYCFAEDTGGFVNYTGSMATLCDLYMPTMDDCYAFGRREVTIYIL